MDSPPYQLERVIMLDIPEPKDSAGGITASDIDNNGRPDFLVTVPGHVAAYSNNGKKLWIHTVDIVVSRQSEAEGLPGHHGPGVAIGDVDGNKFVEVVYLTKDGIIHIVDGRSGKEKATALPPTPKGTARWEFVAICNLRGTGDRDILLQATNSKGYRMGRYLAAYAVNDLLAGKEPLWTTDSFVACAHNAARIADLDGDGCDEILGATVLSPDGKVIVQAVGERWHMDSVYAVDMRPEIPGIEVVLLEEGTNYIQLLSINGLVWRRDYKRQEPQNAAVGRFREGTDKVFIWCRSRYNEHQKPFVFDAEGTMVFTYNIDDVAPKDWTVAGVEVIHTIDWTGGSAQLACAKERHEDGDVCVFEPLTGKFILRIPEKTARLYVADVTGDWREEIIVLNGSELHIYSNPVKNPNHRRTRLWGNSNYRKLKLYHNYYSP